MSSLGSIFEGDEKAGGRGPDLRADVEVPRAGLGVSEGVLVDLPASLPHGGESVVRARHSGDPEDAVRLCLPEGFVSGATLRLRGAGGRGPAGTGDLYLRVMLVEGKMRRAGGADVARGSSQEASSWRSIVLFIAVAAAAALVWLLSRG